MISVLQITQRLVARNRHIDHTSNVYREFHAGIESLIAALGALAPPPGDPLVAAPLPITPADTE